MLPNAKGTENMMPTTLRCRTLLASIAADKRDGGNVTSVTREGRGRQVEGWTVDERPPPFKKYVRNGGKET